MKPKTDKTEREGIMREIKFRAWEKPMIKEWCRKRGISFVPDFKGQMLYLPLDNYYGLSRFFGFLNEEEHILMQYTGLKDKNGVEIYEGDIVKILERDWASQLTSFPELSHEEYLDKISSLARVVFYNGRFRLQQITVNNYYCDYPGDTLKRDIFEVIGNIYQNPELLK